MKSEISTLLAEVTAAPDRINELHAAARKHRQRRVIHRRAAVSGAAVVVGALAFLLSNSKPEKAPFAVPPVASHHAKFLTDDELLDSFGDQSVGLVTWPDGRKQLIAITPAPPGPAKRR